ncbi:MAG: DUF309 domain-containing protein [Acidobacteria bacterium]|nr:DUF309 domain-containing protein [Acidobacteriota bacterium]
MQRGVELFNAGQFYECHDMLEEIWLEEAGEDQLFLQALIQAAVAFHHFQQGHWGAARSMLKMSLEKFAGVPATHRAAAGEVFIRQLMTWKEALDRSISSPSEQSLPKAFPKIAFRAPQES